MPPPPDRSTPLFCATAVVIVLIGILLRFCPSAAFHQAGFDEVLYRAYALALDRQGFSNYDTLTDAYLTHQRLPETGAELPPTRFLFIFSGWVWKRAQFGDAPAVDLRQPGAYYHDPILLSLRHVSAFFTTLLMILSGIAAWRWAGRAAGLAVLALMAFAPLQIHMSQHALIDGFFAFWAALCVWTLWENLRRPNHPGWLAALGFGLIMLVLTKENAFFVYLALAGLIGVNRWAGFGEVTRPLLLVGLIAPALGLITLINLAGGPSNFLETYHLLVTKAEHLEYAILTGDGPWYRYLSDMLLMSPLILCLAIGGAFCVTRESRPCLYLLGFVAFSYLIMCNVRYGMNLRYATMWDLPLRVLAFAQLGWVASHWQLRTKLFLPVAVAALCVYDLAQYRTFFMEHALYELAPDGLLQAVQILK